MSERQVYNPRTRRWEAEDAPVTSALTEPAADLIMPFGQHAGLKLSEVPTDYLRYALREWTMPAFMRQAMEREVETR